MYSSFRDLQLLKACGIPRFAETCDTPRCPYCMVLYTSTSEVRPEIDCAACQGRGELARELEALVVSELESAVKREDAKRIREIAEMFPGTYFAASAKMALVTPVVIAENVRSS